MERKTVKSVIYLAPRLPFLFIPPYVEQVKVGICGKHWHRDPHLTLPFASILCIFYRCEGKCFKNIGHDDGAFPLIQTGEVWRVWCGLCDTRQDDQNVSASVKTIKWQAVYDLSLWEICEHISEGVSGCHEVTFRGLIKKERSLQVSDTI